MPTSLCIALFLQQEHLHKHPPATASEFNSLEDKQQLASQPPLMYHSTKLLVQHADSGLNSSSEQAHGEVTTA